MQPQKKLNDYWKRKQERADWAKRTGYVIITFTKGPRFMITFPTEAGVQDIATKFGGRFRPRTGRWTFPKRNYGAIKRAVEEGWGIDKVTVEGAS